MSSLKQTLRQDLTAAMKARETVTVATLRMALAAVTTEEVAGTEARELTDADVRKVLTKEVRKRKEAAEIYSGAGRGELAERELAESAVLQAYLPSPLEDSEVTALVADAVAEVAAQTGSAPTIKQMGHVVKLAQAKAEGRAEGSRIAAAVRAALQ